MPKALLLLILATCGAHDSNSSPNPDDEQPIQPPDAEEPQEDQYFCCQDVKTSDDAKKGQGDDCTTIDETHVALCSRVLYCPSGYTIKDGDVTCPL